MMGNRIVDKESRKLEPRPHVGKMRPGALSTPTSAARASHKASRELRVNLDEQPRWFKEHASLEKLEIHVFTVSGSSLSVSSSDPSEICSVFPLVSEYSIKSTFLQLSQLR